MAVSAWTLAGSRPFNERLSIGYKLLKKHGVQTTEALLEIMRRLEHELQDSLQVEAGIAAGEKEVQRLLVEVRKRAAVLTKGRQAQAGPLEEQVNRLLKQVGMPNARLKVQVQPARAGRSPAWMPWNSCSMPTKATGLNRSGKWRPEAS